jgi:heptosyltransferase-2
MAANRQFEGSIHLRPQKILVIRLSSIGDIILTTPLLRNLRRRFPKAQIDFVTKATFSDLLRHHPAVDHLHEVVPERGAAGLRKLGESLRQEQYDVVLDVHKNFRSFQLTRAAQAPVVLRHKKFLLRRWLFVQLKWNLLRDVPPIRQRYVAAAAPLGVIDDGLPAEIFSTDEDERRAERALRAGGWDGRSPIIALAPGAGFHTKRWPVENFAEAAVEISKRGDFVVILGGPEDRSLAEEIQRRLERGSASFAGETSLLMSAAILKKCRGLIANDSGLMHMAEAVRIPLVAIFGSTTHELGFFPQAKTSRVIENANLRCRPCSHLGKHRCPKGHFLCMQGISPAQVVAALDGLLGHKIET